MERFAQYIDGGFEAGTAGFDSLDPATGAPFTHRNGPG